ncbi:MAG: hypothetical protein M1826_007553 [Phylliscum demangeonii]|nr:MAG: hypothetical protein M1826_007553 [Phylliscum demangeonii]
MEDLKGLELVLLLSAIVIKDVFCGNLRELFNVLPQPKRRESAGSGLKPKSTSNGDPVDEEVARLQAQVEAERRAKERAEKEEIKRIKKMLAAEEKDARRRQADVEIRNWAATDHATSLDASISLPAGYPFHSEPRRSPHPGPPQSPYPLQPAQSSLRPPPDGRKAASKKKSMFGLRS